MKLEDENLSDELNNGEGGGDKSSCFDKAEQSDWFYAVWGVLVTDGLTYSLTDMGDGKVALTMRRNIDQHLLLGNF